MKREPQTEREDRTVEEHDEAMQGWNEVVEQDREES